MTASKAFLKEKKLRDTTPKGKVFIKVEIIDPENESKKIVCGQFLREQQTHIKALDVQKTMLGVMTSNTLF